MTDQNRNRLTAEPLLHETDLRTKAGLFFVFSPEMDIFAAVMSKHWYICLLAALAVCSGCAAKVKEYKVKIVKEYEHDTSSYTQGLFFYKGEMYESTGLYGSSSFRKVELETGKALEKLKFNRKYFAEGSVELGGKIYVLTWESKVAFVYDAETLTFVQSYSYPREGWGLTTDGKQLIASDGSSRLFFMDADYRFIKSIDVRLNGRPVRYLNELEYIDGKIWANVYMTDIVVIINPETGVVEATVDCTGLLPDSLRKVDTDVLNGIAYNPDTKKLYLTGKKWCRLYEVELVSK